MTQLTPEKIKEIKDSIKTVEQKKIEELEQIIVNLCQRVEWLEKKIGE